jgi:ABC-type oligopeptide transport system substrate-binding subunit
MQAFAFNIRRRKFKAPQLRRALNFAFDFERMNKDIALLESGRRKSQGRQEQFP